MKVSSNLDGSGWNVRVICPRELLSPTHLPFTGLNAFKLKYWFPHNFLKWRPSASMRSRKSRTERVIQTRKSHWHTSPSSPQPHRQPPKPPHFFKASIQVESTQIIDNNQQQLLSSSAFLSLTTYTYHTTIHTYHQHKTHGNFSSTFRLITSHYNWGGGSFDRTIVASPRNGISVTPLLARGATKVRAPSTNRSVWPRRMTLAPAAPIPL